MIYKAEMVFHDLPKTTNILTSSHWRVRSVEQRKWHRLIKEFAILNRLVPPEPLHKAHLRLVRFSSHTLDYDGLVGSFKYVVDGLVEAGILEDDGMKIIGMPDFNWLPAPPKQGKIVIEIEECA